MTCRDCATLAEQPSWPGYTYGCQACHERALRPETPQEEFARRKLAWVADNPGATLWEYRDACARIREEIGE